MNQKGNVKGIEIKAYLWKTGGKGSSGPIRQPEKATHTLGISLKSILYIP